MSLHTGSLHPTGLWPDSVVPERTQIFLRRFFQLLDACDEENAVEYGKLFAEDATYVVARVSITKGRKALVDQRIWGWKIWPELQHCIRHVYLGDRDGLDVVTVGTFAICPADGRHRSGGSAAHFRLVDQEGGLVIQHLEIFSDPTPIMDMIPAA